MKGRRFLTLTLMWPSPWCMTLTLLMTCSHIQRVKKLKLVKLSFFLIWPWPWPNDLYTQTWPRYDQDVPAYQKWSFYVKRFKSYSLNRQTDRHDRKHYLPAYAGGNKCPMVCSHFMKANVTSLLLYRSRTHLILHASVDADTDAWAWMLQLKSTYSFKRTLASTLTLGVNRPLKG